MISKDESAATQQQSTILSSKDTKENVAP